MSEPSTLPVATNEGDKAARRAIKNILDGKLNSWGEITLTANSATSTLTDPRIGINSVILFQPTTSNAAAALANLYVGNPGSGTVTLNHTSNAQVDRTFRYAIIG